MLRDKHGVPLKCLGDGGEVMKVEDGGCNHECKEEKQLEDKLGENGDNAGSHYLQTASHTLSDEVLGGLRGLNGAILLLQKARNDLLRQVWLLIIFHCHCFELQVGMSAAGSVDSAKEEEETMERESF